jgi:mRNA interferase YafQ
VAIEKQKRKTPDDFFKSLEKHEGFVYNVYNTNTFKRSVKLCYKRNLDLELLEEIIVKLARKEELPENNYPHPLKGYKKKQFEEIMECHIKPDWLLVWTQNDAELVLLLINTGSHADLFGR